jgi:hypothetical protein
MYYKINCIDVSSLTKKSTFQLLIYMNEMDVVHFIPAAERKPVYSIL